MKKQAGIACTCWVSLSEDERDVFGDAKDVLHAVEECLVYCHYSQQPLLETFADRVNRKIANGEIEVITPGRNADGVAILESEEYDDVGE